MAYALGKKSKSNLEGVHPVLANVVTRAIKLTTQDFQVFEGLRSLTRQQEYVKRGVSKTLNSKHRIQADGYGHAVDLVPMIDKTLRWEWGAIYPIAAAMLLAALDAGVSSRIKWGGIWDRDLDQLIRSCPALATIPSLTEHLKIQILAYQKRHPGPDFLDGPHFEMIG